MYVLENLLRLTFALGHYSEQKEASYLCKVQPAPFPPWLDSGRPALPLELLKGFCRLYCFLFRGLTLVQVGPHSGERSSPAPRTHPGIVHVFLVVPGAASQGGQRVKIDNKRVILGWNLKARGSKFQTL